MPEPSRDSSQSLSTPAQFASNRSSNRSANGVSRDQSAPSLAMSRQASSFDRISPSPTVTSSPRPISAFRKPRLPPIRQESLKAKQELNADDRRSRMLDGGRGTRKVPPGAMVAMESQRRVIVSQLMSKAAREGVVAERAEAKLKLVVAKAETLLGSERGEEEAVVSEALLALRAAEAEAESARKAAQAAAVKADVELDLVLDEEEEMARRAKRSSLGRQKKKRGKVATACAMSCLLCWLSLVLVSVFVGTGYDHYLVNEVDYWYPVRLCRRRAGGDTPAFDEFNATLQVGADTPTCKAATELTRCDGFTCNANGCNTQQLTTEQCSSCCGGTLLPVLSPCQFPFGSDSSSTCVPSSSVPGAPNDASHWCADGDDAFGRCDNACAQADFVGAQPSSCGADGFTCAADGSAPSDVTIQIGRSGYGGDAGFRVGAAYTLVLFGAADHLAASAQLVAATGEVLFAGEFDSSRCDSRRRRLGHAPGDVRLDQKSLFSSHEVGVRLSAQPTGSLSSDAGLGPPQRRRLEGVRLVTWWTELTGYANLALERHRFGSDARWGGDQTPRIEPTQSAGLACARNAVPAYTRVALQRSAPQSADGAMEQCTGAVRPGSQAQDGGSGEAALGWDTLRAEMGSRFVLQPQHFPLNLVVSGARASVRGRGPAGSNLTDTPPELYFSFYTDEFNYSTRSAMWFGLPFGIILGSCCCCCLLKCFFRKPRKARKAGRDGRDGLVTVVGRDSEMTDLGHYRHDGHDPEMST